MKTTLRQTTIFKGSSLKEQQRLETKNTEEE